MAVLHSLISPWERKGEKEKKNSSYNTGYLDLVTHPSTVPAEHSLRSKRFRRVWEQRNTEERGFRYFACAENGARAKKRTVGVGEGKEGTACGQTPGF